MARRKGRARIVTRAKPDPMTARVVGAHGKVRTVRVGDLEVSYDEQQALESYRRIRAGSLIGGMFTRTVFAKLSEAMGPRWRDRIMGEIAGAPEAMEEEREEEREEGAGDTSEPHH